MCSFQTLKPLDKSRDFSTGVSGCLKNFKKDSITDRNF